FGGVRVDRKSVTFPGPPISGSDVQRGCRKKWRSYFCFALSQRCCSELLPGFRSYFRSAEEEQLRLPLPGAVSRATA
ncbi:hypothetical protein U0070_023115, partial [Myodes glareolus]